MIIQCSICKRIRKFGDWIQLSNAFYGGYLPKDIPVEYMLCDTCKGINGGCERLRKLEKKVTIFDKAIAVIAAFWTMFAVIGGLILLQWCANR